MVNIVTAAGNFIFRAWRLVVAWIVFLGFMLLAFLVTYGLQNRDKDWVVRDRDAYHAIFLDGNQVYFGKLSDVNPDQMSLSDIFYLRAGIIQQPGAEPSDGAQIDLIKLGSELHAPTDEMLINKDKIQFYEQLKEDGEVMKLIRAYKQGS